MFDDDEKRDPIAAPSSPTYTVGYKKPPMHTRFKPGHSGNPSGRAKGSQNLKTLFQKILKEQVPMRDGTRLRNISKAEAIMRGLVLNALKGDGKSLMTLFRLAEQTGEFDKDITRVERLIVQWKSNDGPREE